MGRRYAGAEEGNGVLMAVNGLDLAGSLYISLVRDRATVDELRQATVGEHLPGGTLAITGLVAGWLRDLGLDVAAKGQPGTSLAMKQQEYRTLDVPAFPDAGSAWRFRVTVWELGNWRSDQVVAYALWKVLCIRHALRAVFRSVRAVALRLIGSVADRVVGVMALYGSRTTAPRHARVRGIAQGVRHVSVRLLFGLVSGSEPRPIRDLQVAGIGPRGITRWH